MSVSTEIISITNQIEELKYKLAFLNDSNEFYQLDLGTGTKNVLIIDFDNPAGYKVTSTDNDRKVSTTWFKNFMGYMTTQENQFRLDFRRLRALQKLTLIHRFLETTEFPVDLTGHQTETNWYTIGLDNAGDRNANPQTAYVAVAVPTTDFSGTSKPAIQQGVFYFSSQANAEAAITHMIDTEKDNNSFNDLDYLFNQTLSTNAELNV